MGHNSLLYTKIKDNKTLSAQAFIENEHQNYKNSLLLFSDSMYKVYTGGII